MMRMKITAGGLCMLLAALAPSAVLAQQTNTKAKKPRIVTVPVFRHIDPSRTEPDLKAVTSIRFLVVDDFPPMSYRDRNNQVTGFNIAVATNICRVFRLTCSYKVVPYAQLLEALQNNEGDAVLTSLPKSVENAKLVDFTRPYLRLTARFAVRKGTPFSKADIREFAGKRLGATKDTHHEAFLKRFYRRSKLLPFENDAKTFEALRTGAVDAVFSDSFRLMFWLNGKASRDCCRFAGGAFVEPGSFSRPLTIAVRRENQALKKLLDYGLDRLQISGRFATIYRQYFPASVWKGN